MRRLVRRCDSQAGFTLVEVLLAISILGIGVVVLVGGMMTSITVSDQGRRDAEAQLTVRAYADFLMEQPYKDCPVTTEYDGFTATGWDTPRPLVAFWNPNADGSTGSFGACAVDSGIQRLRLTVDSRNGALTTQTLTIVKRRPT